MTRNTGEKTSKRKGLGGLSPEKKKLLKQLIMQKAADDLKKLHEKEVEEKKKFIESRVANLSIDGLSQDDLEKKVYELYEVVCRLEDEKYDWEMRIRKQDYEMNELNVKVNDIKGHFVKPMLKKVSKSEQKLAKFDKEKLKSKLGFLTNLKSTGQSKFALDDREEMGKKPDWGQDQLKHKESEFDERKDDDKEKDQDIAQENNPEAYVSGEVENHNDDGKEENEEKEYEEEEEEGE